jgi:alkaline phosphatase
MEIRSARRASAFGLCLFLSLGEALPLAAQAPQSPQPAAPATPATATAPAPETKETFMARARAQVQSNEKIRPKRRKARNVILFVGDGMGVTTITAARILEGQQRGLRGEENVLSFERFPYLAHSKTYQANQQVPDSAPTMTAIVTGSKANDGSISIAPNVAGADFAAAALPQNRLRTILEEAESRGLWTGVVSTATITHATPAACYAHTPNRGAESDADLAEISPAAAAAGYPDIARQLVEFKLRPTKMNGKDSPGLEVALGGGRAKFTLATTPDPEYPDKPDSAGERKDRDLTEVWKQNGGVYVQDKAGFDALDPKTTGPVLGLFEPSYMQFELDRAQDKAGEPSLTEMTEKAIRILQRGPKGYFLMVEGGRIDHAHHGGNAIRALHDAIALSRAVERAAALTGDDTLIVVTADHSHVFTMGGYPARGNPILGLVVETNFDTGLPESSPAKARDGKPYTTLGYANGPGAVTEPRADLTGVDTTAPNFRQQALVPLGSESHGGEDVVIYARGPQAHLFQGTLEQNAIYFVMAKALGFW